MTILIWIIPAAIIVFLLALIFRRLMLSFLRTTAGDCGACDDIPTPKVVSFINDLDSHFKANHSDLLTEIREKATFKKNDLKDRINAAILAFRANWAS